MRLAALLFALVLTMTAGNAARAAESATALPQADRDAIHSVIEGQIGAFRSGDDAAAFAFAAPAIQQQFTDAGHFVAMVRQAYAPVYHPRSMSFGALVEMDGIPVQKLRVVGPDGAPALALYYMEHETDGSWRIGGCQLAQDDSVGA